MQQPLAPGALTPPEFIAQLSSQLHLLSTAEQTRLTSVARSWSAVYYQGLVPSTVQVSLEQLEAKCRS
jgi:hypothetical protein